ncbi:MULTISPECIES: hypothetical protein [unclassified Microcoleus]|uniref:hypothetical protein n=1 Tax=unclassified Microcoleus TaxID=2642155 RepID=UPI002FD39879
MTYKVGDRIKLKRKTPAAACLKKGDVIQIAAIHPQTGSCKFWNERTESWGYVESDEFTLLPPEIDSVSPASTLADTEYTVEVADTEYIVEVADTEYIAEVADTEYIAEVAEDDSVLKAISTYQPRGTARSGEYFRFSYREGLKMRHVHIRGGSTDSLISQAKVAEVRSLQAAGIPAAEIAAMLRNSVGKAQTPLSC